MQLGNGEFLWDMVGTLVSEWVYTASILSDQRWNHIMDLCGAQDMEQKAVNPKECSVSFNHHTLYEPSSSIEGSGSE